MSVFSIGDVVRKKSPLMEVISITKDGEYVCRSETDGIITEEVFEKDEITKVIPNERKIEIIEMGL